MAVGDFTPTRLADINLKMEEMWAEPQKTKNYTANGETIKAIMENQTAEFKALEDPTKLYDVNVQWIDFCADNAVDTQAADQCPMDATCPEGEGKSQNYALDIFIEDCYSVNEDKLETSNYSPEEVIALGLLKAKKSIIERFNLKADAVIAANMGVNPYEGDFASINGVSGYTDIQKKDFNIETLYPYWSLVMALQRSNSAFVLDGGNLYQQALVALKDYANSDGKLDMGLFELFPFYQDLFGFARAGISDNTYLIDAGAMAVVTRSKYPSTPRWIGGTVQQTRYQVELEQLPGVFLDVAYQPVCSADSILHKWNLKLRAGVFVNPTMCDANNTGILGFKKVANLIEG